MKGENFLALFGIGHVRHQVDLASLQLGQAVTPIARNVFKFPGLFFSNVAQDVDKNAGCLLVGVEEDFGFVVLNADQHISRLRNVGHRQRAE